MRVARPLRRAAAVFLLGGALAVFLAVGTGRTDTARQHQLRLAVAAKLRAVGAEQDRAPAAKATRRALPSAYAFPHRAAAPSARLAATASEPLVFGQPTISGIGGVGFEQDLRLDPTNGNRIYTSVPGSLSSDTSWIWRSLDGGRTFKWVPSATPLTGKATACAGGGDTELAIDSGGSVYFNDLTLANFSTARSDDLGATFACSNTGVPDAGVDRQWYAIDGNPLAGGSIYLANDEIGPGAVQCGDSVGNNVLVMYRSPAAGAAASAGIEFAPANKVTRENTCDEGIMGNNEVSPFPTRTGELVQGNPTQLPRAVKHVYVIHDDATFTKIAIGRCFPVAFGVAATNASDPSGLRCNDLPVADLGKPGTVKTGGNFPTLAIDKAGNLYAVWERASVKDGKVLNTYLYYAYSTDEGTTWSAPIKIPTPGLSNNVFAWIAAGDDGSFDVAWYGAKQTVDLVNGGPSGCTGGGPDSVDGIWSLWVTQTSNGHDPAGAVFSPPVLASEHYVHRGGIQTVIGGQCGDRTLGDFLQVRIGSHGDAQIAYADSNNVDEIFAPHAMFVRQASGPGVYADRTVGWQGIAVGQTADFVGDATYEALGVTSANMPNLDIRASSITVPAASACHPAGVACFRVKMTISDMNLTAPAAPDSDDDLVWLTQWLVPASPSCTGPAVCVNGGKNPIVYAESNAGGAVRCFSGENAAQAIGGGISLTYPGTSEITAPGACLVKNGPIGSITIDVPQADVGLGGGATPLNSTLYSVTASTMTLPAPADSVAPIAGIGGVFFNLIDVAPGYEVHP